MNYHLIAAILKSTWAIDTQFAINSLPMISDLLSGKLVLEPTHAFAGQARSTNAAGGSSVHALDDAPAHSLAIIHLHGTLLKHDQACGELGMASIGGLIQQADKNPHIDGICLSIDSPGGTVDGTAALASIVKGTQKPIVAFVDGLMASAALWIGTSTDYVVASNDHAQVGSVGVLMSFVDVQPYYEKQGVKYHTIVAPQSSEKVKMWEDLREGHYDQYKNEVLSPLASEFISVVKANRPLAEEKHLKGKVFFAKDVLGALVDEIGDIQVALDHLSAMIDSNSQSNKSNANMKSFKRINALVEAELVVSDDGANLSLEALEAVENALDTSNAADQALQADLKKVRSQLELLQADLTRANQTIAVQTIEIAELKNEPADDSAVAITNSDKSSPAKGDKNITSEDKSFLENLNAVGNEFLP